MPPLEGGLFPEGELKEWLKENLQVQHGDDGEHPECYHLAIVRYPANFGTEVRSSDDA